MTLREKTGCKQTNLNNFPLKTLKLGRVAFHSVTLLLFKCLDFQSNQYKKLVLVLSRFCNCLLIRMICLHDRCQSSVDSSRIWWHEYSCYDTRKWRQWLVNIRNAALPQFFRKEMLTESIKRLFNWENDKEVNNVQEDPEQLPAASPPDKNRSVNLHVNVKASMILFFRLGALFTRRYRRYAPSWFRRRQRKR